ncbi:MotA/TolQ/ExbB proton channel family protein [Antarctobacter sp.]|uniref:MotA/TolQ/ExbB proton channel family protein n=1 Tax=Antarctobacter sp. TaxID=1872577 RepID=UPI002B26F5E9|nr:MotA/TolQ/ExbB proton channel family protein [Antarctobacter sp.]
MTPLRRAEDHDFGALPIRPWRSLLISAALVALTVAVFRDLGLTDPRSIADAARDMSRTATTWVTGLAETPPEGAPDATPSPADPAIAPDAPTSPPPVPEIVPQSSPEGGGHPLLTRILSDPIRLVFAAGCLATLIFIAVQLTSLAIDTRLVSRHEARAGLLTPLAQLTRLFAARRLRVGHPDRRRLDAFELASEGDIIADPLRLGLTAFPMLGFLGTVVGLSGAIESLPGAIGNPDALQPVLSELHVAFDTTLLGLIGALICLIGAKAIDQAWDRLSRRAGLE